MNSSAPQRLRVSKSSKALDAAPLEWYAYDMVGRRTSRQFENGAGDFRSVEGLEGHAPSCPSDCGHDGACPTRRMPARLDPRREWIASARLYDYRHRAYSPTLGRFLQTDPIRFAAGDFNIYRYVGNNPANWVDPWGLSGDKYVPDNSGKHGGPHVDRYDKGGNNVGRYNKDGSGIPHKGKYPPKIPKSDLSKFHRAAGRLPLLLLLLPLLDKSNGMTPLYDKCGKFIGYGA